MKVTDRIYGLHAVRVLLERHPGRVHGVPIAQQRDDPRVRATDELARRHHRPVQRVELRALQQLRGDVAHKGVAADITPLPPWSEDELLAALQNVSAPLLLALDGVQDPHNLGACLRSADACGALGVIVPRDRAAQVTPTVRKVAVGAAGNTPRVARAHPVRTPRLLQAAGAWGLGPRD